MTVTELRIAMTGNLHGRHWYWYGLWWKVMKKAEEMQLDWRTL